MQLTQHTEYALRILLYLSLQDKQKLINITEIAQSFSLPRNHIVKIVHKLGKLEFIRTTRGKGGGIQLNHSSDAIVIGDVVRKLEANLEIVNCEKTSCPILPACKLKNILDLAGDAFLQTLDMYSLADINQQPQMLLKLLHNHKEQKQVSKAHS